MSRSLRRTLAVRFAATMGAGLLVAAAAAYGVAVGPAAGMHRELLFLLAGVVVLGTGATLVGAWWLAGSAVRPVYEITEQATSIEGGTLGQRIVAHAETDEYRGLVAVLNRMLERIDAAFKNQQRLTADVSHELRSPLTALRGEMEVALRSERSPRDYQRVLHSALEEIDRRPGPQPGHRHRPRAGDGRGHRAAARRQRPRGERRNRWNGRPLPGGSPPRPADDHAPEGRGGEAPPDRGRSHAPEDAEVSAR